MNAARLLSDARHRADLTQRQLASAAGVPQASIARIERGTISPRTDTLDRLLRACGMELESSHLLGVGVDRTAIRERLRLTPAERSRLGVREARAARWAEALAARGLADRGAGTVRVAGSRPR